jgi:penicillin-binding protein 1C
MALQQNPLGGKTYIDLDIQQQIEKISNKHLDTLPQQTELAVAVIDIERSCLTALIGSGDPSDPVDGQVNGAFARRSPGSALKPFIYAAAFEAQRLSPDSIVYDVPIQLAGWSPHNFDRTYSGPVTARYALRQSLNTPALWIANCLGMGRCCHTLESLGIRLPDDTTSRIGLSIAVGGSETSLFELTNAYAALGRSGVYRDCRLFPDDPSTPTTVFDSNICAAINDILSSKNTAPQGMDDIAPQDVGHFIWKTGTSSGRRDAWAIGHNGRYAIGVWVGRFRGTGRIEYVGAIAAEPLLAKLFSLPKIRNNTAPATPETIVVKNPLPRPYRKQEKLHILSPENGDVFVALNGSVAIKPQTNQTGNFKGLLNGNLVSNDKINSLNVTPGNYTLHCIKSTGQFSKVAFSVQ